MTSRGPARLFHTTRLLSAGRATDATSRDGTARKVVPTPTAGRKPSRACCLPVTPGEPYTLTLEGDIPNQAVNSEAGLYLEGKKIAPLQAGKVVTASLPPCAGDMVRLELRSAGWVPQQVAAGSKDPRTLGSRCPESPCAPLRPARRCSMPTPGPGPTLTMKTVSQILRLELSASCSPCWRCLPMRGAVSVSPEEMGEASQWVAAKFKGVVASEAPAVGLVVLANNDPVQLNARAGRPLKIADKQYSRGLYCHAVSKVVVRLPGPGKSFSAIAGVDSNEQTSGGRGSVVFSVNVGGQGRIPLTGHAGGHGGRASECAAGRRPGVYAGGRRCGRRHLVRPVGLGGRQGRAGRWPGTLAGRPAAAQ